MNPTTATTERHRASAGLVALAVALGFVGVALPAAPAGATAQAPMLSISVDNGHTSTRAGDSLDYTVSVKNLGAVGVTGLRVTQTMPAGLAFGSADRGGAVAGKLVVWSIDLTASSTVSLHTTMRVGATPDDVLRLATVACAALSEKKAPIVCATHSDELPAGARAVAAAGAHARASTGSDTAMVLVWGGLGGLFLVIAGAAVVVVRRRRA